MTIGLRPATPATAHYCPVRDVLDRVADRWSILVMLTLAPDTMRFTVLKRAIGDISPRVLAQTLRHLEQDGLVERTAYPTIPPRVDYALSPLGHSLLEPLGVLYTWAESHHEAIRQARAHYAHAAAPAGDDAAQA